MHAIDLWDLLFATENSQGIAFRVFLGSFHKKDIGVPSGTSRTYRSLLLAISSSTINKLSAYMILISWHSESFGTFVGI
jgi:hypothetical protein